MPKARRCYPYFKDIGREFSFDSVQTHLRVAGLIFGGMHPYLSARYRHDSRGTCCRLVGWKVRAQCSRPKTGHHMGPATEKLDMAVLVDIPVPGRGSARMIVPVAGLPVSRLRCCLFFGVLADLRFPRLSGRWPALGDSLPGRGFDQRPSSRHLDGHRAAGAWDECKKFVEGRLATRIGVKAPK